MRIWTRSSILLLRFFLSQLPQHHSITASAALSYAHTHVRLWLLSRSSRVGCATIYTTSGRARLDFLVPRGSPANVRRRERLYSFDLWVISRGHCRRIRELTTIILAEGSDGAILQNRLYSYSSRDYNMLYIYIIYILCLWNLLLQKQHSSN